MKSAKRDCGDVTTDLVAQDRAYVWHPFTPMKPWCEEKEIVVIESGEGEFLIDTEGRRYIDGVSSLWCNVHGHRVAELDAAVREQLGKIAHSTLLGLANVPSIQLAGRLVELARRAGGGAGLGLEKVFYSDDGSTAVEVACKMAYQYWRNIGQGPPEGRRPKGWRERFIAFGNAYHGDTLGAVSLGGIELFHEAFRGLCFGVDFVEPPSFDSDWNDAVLEEISRLIWVHPPETYAAIVIEPLVLGAGGMLMYPASVLRDLRRLADAANILLIFDEVLTGFGRTGKMFAAEHAVQSGDATEEHAQRAAGAAFGAGHGTREDGGHGTRTIADIVCLSKGLTGGYMPLGVTMTTRRVFDAFYVDPNEPGNSGKTFFHGHTFTGHPLACAVALASLELFEKNRVIEHVQELMPILAETLQRARGSAYVADVRQCGLIGAIDLAEAGMGTGERRRFPYHWRVGGELCRRMRELGVMMRPLADTLVIMPPLAIPERSFRHLCESVIASLAWIPEIVAGKTGDT